MNDIMDKEEIKTLILIFLMAISIISYLIYVLHDEHKYLKYYNKNLYYATDWDKYSTMVEKQKIILLKKRISLMYYKTLLFLKRIVIWKH